MVILFLLIFQNSINLTFLKKFTLILLHETIGNNINQINCLKTRMILFDK